MWHMWFFFLNRKQETIEFHQSTCRWNVIKDCFEGTRIPLGSFLGSIGEFKTKAVLDFGSANEYVYNILMSSGEGFPPFRTYLANIRRRSVNGLAPMLLVSCIHSYVKLPEGIYMGHKSLRSLSGMQIQVLSGKDRNIWDHLRKIWNTCGHLEIQHQSTETFQGSSCRILTNGHRQGLQFRVLHPTWKGQKKNYQQLPVQQHDIQLPQQGDGDRCTPGGHFGMGQKWSKKYVAICILYNLPFTYFTYDICMPMSIYIYIHVHTWMGLFENSVALQGNIPPFQILIMNRDWAPAILVWQPGFQAFES